MILASIRENNWPQFLKLTSREIDVIACLMDDRSAKKIATILGVKQKTIETHIFNIMQKLDKHSRASIVEFAKKSEYSQQLILRYREIYINYEFKETLQKIRNYTQNKRLMCKIICPDFDLKNKIETDLCKLNILCSDRRKEAIEITIEIFDDYYVTFFMNLKNIFNCPLVEDAILYFQKKNTEPIIIKSMTPTAQNFLKNWQNIFFIFLLFIGIIGCGLKLFVFTSIYTPTVYSDLYIPIPSKILNRKEILKKINSLLLGKESIKIAAIVGIGGSGKTTIVRQYATTAKASIIWEINAENVLTSFSNLAFILAKTNSEKIELDRIRKIQNQNEYSEQLLYFIKQKLLKDNNWLLVFDNVKTLKEIQAFLPTDKNTWGRGRVLITSRNYLIANNGFIEQSKVITIPELTTAEKENLFIKIQETSATKSSQLRKFLAVIPSFPLDVSIAAYYIKNTKCSYEDYIKLLYRKQNLIHEKNLVFSAENDCMRVRYRIVTSIFDQMLLNHPDFRKILMLISIIDPQNIPKTLLKECAEPTILNEFIQILSQSSLLICQAEKNQNDTFFSMHNSTQNILSEYLQSTLIQLKFDEEMDTITTCLYNYAEKIIDTNNVLKLRTLVNILTFFLNNNTLSLLSKGKIALQLGRAYCCLSSYTKSNQYLNLSQRCLEKSNSLKTLCSLLPKILVYRGIIETDCGKFKQGRKTLQESIAIYRRDFPKNTAELAFSLLHLGLCCKELSYFEEGLNVLDQSIAIYSQHNNKNNTNIASCFCFKGDIYSKLGNIEKAMMFYQKSLDICKKEPVNSSKKQNWILFRMGVAYKDSGQYLKGRKIIETAYNVHTKKYVEDVSASIWMSIHLGDVYRKLGLYQDAEFFLKKACLLSNYYYGKDSAITKWSMTFFGQLLAEQGKHAIAMKIFEESLILHKYCFSDNHLKNLQLTGFLADLKKKLGYHDQARNFYFHCRNIYKTHYGTKHPYYSELLLNLAHLEILEQRFEAAGNLLQEFFKISDIRRHAETYRYYKYIGDIYAGKGQQDKARNYYIKAFIVAKHFFPKNSIHIFHLKKNISWIQRLYCTIQIWFSSPEQKGSVAIF